MQKRYRPCFKAVPFLHMFYIFGWKLNGGPSAFDCSEQSALGEMLLNKRISGQHRHGGDDNDRHFDRLGRRHNIDRASLCLHPAGDNNDLAQQHLDRPFCRIIHIEDRVHVRVPVSNRVEQGDGGYGRQGERQHNPHEDSEVIASVDLGGFLQTVRQSLEEVAHDNHVEGIDGNREDQGPVRVDQADAFDD